jgi:PAS domain S-box-containing protein
VASSSGSLDEILQLIADRARAVIGADVALISYVRAERWSHGVTAVSLSQRYEPWRAVLTPPDGSGCAAEVCRSNRVMRRGQDDLVAHPLIRGAAGPGAEPPPPPRGWLAVPLVAHDGTNLGLLQLSDAYDGDFDELDETVARELAHLASAVVENTAAADQLRRSEERFRSLVLAGATDVWRTDATGHLVSDMPQWRSVTGQTPEQLAGYGWLAGVHQDDRDRVLATWESAVAAQTPYVCEYRIVGPRTQRIFLARAVPIVEGGDVVEWVGTTQDVTDVRTMAAQAVAAGERAERLQAVTAGLSGALTVSEVVDVVLEHGAASLGASGYGVALLDEARTTLRFTALRGYDTTIVAAWIELRLDERVPVTSAVRAGQPVFVSDPDLMRRRFPAPALRSFVKASGEQAWAALPLRTSGSPFGVLWLGFPEERAFDADERAFLAALAAQCAQALERARLYERERGTASLLQRSLLPERLPDLPDVQTGAVYFPATAGVDVGGDWYDAFVVAGGRLGFVLGDVMGKGARAASVMGQVRNALRAYAALDPDPPVVLARLDTLFAAYDNDEELVTLVYAVLNPASGALRYVNAGHLPPLLGTPDGAVVTLEEASSLPLGIGTFDRPAADTRIPPDGVLLLYSDGLVESRRRGLNEGLPALVAEFAAVLRTPGAPWTPPQAGPLCTRLRDALVPAGHDDDVTMLAVVRHPSTAPSAASSPPEHTARLLLPGDLTGPRTARHFLSERLRCWGADRFVERAALCTSEVVTNAIVHGGARAELVGVLHADTLRVTVRDEVPDGPRSRETALDDTSGRGLSILDAIADDWGVVSREDGKEVWFELRPHPLE